ncbi:MAG: PEP-CTERM sorting domain-containing protein [Phycisphaeraceae bacterium]|nr:PEP-CTERM sorting domain-containing protein [Phycisphaeraceae bacterium]
MTIPTRILSLAMFLVISAAAQATPLMEETFDYTVGPLAGNNGGTGFSDAWVSTIPSTTATIDITSGSIAFSDYATTGNKVTLDLVTEPAGPAVAIYSRRTVSVGVPSGDMWVSYLYQRQDAAGDNTSRTARVGFNDGVIHFDTAIKASSSQGIAVRYEGSFGTAAADVSVQDGSAYMAIVKYADLGNIGSLASFWVFSAAGFDSIKGGGIDESELDGAAVLKATDTVSTAEVLTAFLDQLSLVNVSNTYPFKFDIDEIRMSTTLADVVPVAALQPGDANGDGMVNLSDLQILGDNWQSTTATWSEADFTGDSTVNLADLQILGDNWGFGTGPDVSFDEALAQVAVPEPAAIGLLGIGGLMLLHRRRAC